MALSGICHIEKMNRISVILETIHSSGMMNEQHIFCYAYYEGGYFLCQKIKFQDVIFTIIMVFVMVYTMICYNIALNVGGMNNQVFFKIAFHELVIMGPIAFILDFFPDRTICKEKMHFPLLIWKEIITFTW